MGLAWATKQVGGQPELYSKTLSEKKRKNGRRGEERRGKKINSKKEEMGILTIEQV